MYKHICMLLLFFLASFGSARAEALSPSEPDYLLSVSFDVPASQLCGVASVRVESGSVTKLDVSNLIIKRVSLDGRDVAHDIREGILTVGAEAAGTLEIDYEVSGKATRDDQAENPDSAATTIDKTGIILSRRWYPKPQGLFRSRLQARFPKGYEALSEAERIEKSEQSGSVDFIFHFEHLREGISLVATDRYEILADRVNGIDLYAYVLRGNRGLGRGYLDQAKKYLSHGEHLLSPYPYKRLSIAENFLNRELSAPTFILLSKQKPGFAFSANKPLGRALIAQWFGNHVFADPESGNWTPGLTTYLTGRFDQEQPGSGWEYRKQLLLDYESLVNSKNETSLRELKDGKDRALQAIAEGKGFFLFHMLRTALGDQAFHDSLRMFISDWRYRPASWDNIRTAFEKTTGKDLSGFFTQWVEQKGLPYVSAGNASVKRKSAGFEITLEVLQGSPHYLLDLTAFITFVDGDSKNEILKLDAEKNVFTLSIDQEPQSVVIDRDYDIARRLTTGESPPRVAALLGDDNLLIVLPAGNREPYAPVLSELKRRGGEEREAAGLKNAVIKTSSLAILGDDNPLIEGLFGKVKSFDSGFSMIVKRNPWNERKTIAIINARSVEESRSALPAFFSYGRYSALAFDQGGSSQKTTEDSSRGIEMKLREPAVAIDLAALKSLSAVVENGADKKIIYVGEYHDKYAHHAVQLRVIKDLYRKNPRLAVGMEMFQRPFQKVLDEYVSGAIDERTFLKKSEYFKRWVFDYNLYKPILDFARSKNIPVIALNQKKEITEKVSKEGLDALAPEERGQIPDGMDFSDDEYRERLKAVFDRHKGRGERNFDFFYQAQVLWDETMALSIDEFLQKNRDHRMVVIAGSGHLAYGSGIPKRSFRRNGLPYSIVLNDSEVDRDIGDYVVLPGELEGTAAPKLMAALKAENGRVSITELPADSVAKKAGLAVGDTVLAIDNESIESVEDIKLVLFYKEQGDTARVKVLRKRLFFRDREMHFDVKL